MEKEQLGSGFPFAMLVRPEYYKMYLRSQLVQSQNSTHVIHFALNALIKGS